MEKVALFTSRLFVSQIIVKQKQRYWSKFGRNLDNHLHKAKEKVFLWEYFQTSLKQENDALKKEVTNLKVNSDELKIWVSHHSTCIYRMTKYHS